MGGFIPYAIASALRSMAQMLAWPQHGGDGSEKSKAMTKRLLSLLKLPPSIRLRVFGLALCGGILFFISAGALGFFCLEDAAKKSYVAAGQQRVNGAAAMASGSGNQFAALASAIALQADVLEVTLFAADGKMIAQRIRQTQNDLPRRIFRAPVQFSPGDEGIVEMHLAYPGSVGGFGRVAWVFAVTAVLFTCILFVALDRILINPLGNLLRRAQELNGLVELEEPLILRAEGYPELLEITDILNAMSRRVFDVRQRMGDKVNLANTTLISTVKLLQDRSTELKVRSQELEMALEDIGRLATTDSLTGVHNRRYFDASLRHALARAKRFDQPIAMVLFDIDKFKHINDTLGHAAGDVVLEDLAGLVKACARASDVFARLGGDEFAFILEKTGLAEAKKMGVNLLASVAGYPFSYEMHAIPVTLSIGIVVFPHPPRDGETLYKAADDALYDAKRNGRNQVVAYSFDVNATRLVSNLTNN